MTFTLLLGMAGCSHSDKSSGESRDSGIKIAGNYICFEENNGTVSTVLKRGILTIDDGKIADIEEIGENTDGVVCLDDEYVIFPGLIDLHSHVEYNSMQLWESSENDVPWDNRFEWRKSAQYTADLKEKQAAISEQWEDPVGESDAVTGDLIEYFAEAQAAAGGTTLIQGYNQTDAYDTADSHEKVDLIRDTCFSGDLGVEAGNELQCVIQLYKPDADLDSNVPETYQPPIDTSGWKEVKQLTADETTDVISTILESIKNGTSNGWLIHIGEGRAGNLSGDVDSYSRLEYELFKKAILTGIENGDFTANDVRNANVVLIHACGVDLDNKEDYEFIRDCGIGLIWSPVSNLLLYEDTPSFYNYLNDDALRVGIGSDWSPSGSKTVWDECKFAYCFMQKHTESKAVSSEALLRACTYNASRMIGNTSVGNITVGGFADLFILKGSDKVNGNKETALNTFIETDDSGVEAVIADGKIIYADSDFLTSAMGGEIPASYGKYDTGNSALNDKYFLVPPLFEDYSFEELYEKYTAVIEGAGCELSRLRGSEDSVYTNVIHQLEESFCR